MWIFIPLPSVASLVYGGQPETHTLPDGRRGIVLVDATGQVRHDGLERWWRAGESLYGVAGWPHARPDPEAGWVESDVEGLASDTRFPVGDIVPVGVDTATLLFNLMYRHVEPSIIDAILSAPQPIQENHSFANLARQYARRVLSRPS